MHRLTVSGLNKEEMFEIPLVTLIESIILFDNRYYNQADWVAMVPPLVQN